MQDKDERTADDPKFKGRKLQSGEKKQKGRYPICSVDRFAVQDCPVRSDLMICLKSFEGIIWLPLRLIVFLSVTVTFP